MTQTRDGAEPRANQTENGLCWVPTWTQAMSDFRGANDEPDFHDVTVRLTVPASIGGNQLRAELSNRFGDQPVRVGRGAIGISDHFAEIAFDGQAATEIPPGQSRWTDPITRTVKPGDHIVVDLYLPQFTPYATAAGFSFDRSVPGDFAGSRPFPLEGSTPESVDTPQAFPAPTPSAEPDGAGWSLPPGGPFLRTIEVAGANASAVIVALGGSSTAMGWPQYTAALLPPDANIAIVNRGISGNRIRLDAPPHTPSWGRSGLSRFNEDVLDTHGVTHVVIAYNSNDWGLPGRITPIDEMPSRDQLLDGYRQLIDRAQAAGLHAILATVTPLAPELLSDPGREDLRQALNHWIRTSGQPCVDFDAAIRSTANPSRLRASYAAPDDTHPNTNGEKQLAYAMLTTIKQLRL